MSLIRLFRGWSNLILMVVGVAMFALVAGVTLWMGSDLGDKSERSEALQGVSGVAGFAVTLVLLVLNVQANWRAYQAQEDTRAAIAAAQAQAKAMQDSLKVARQQSAAMEQLARETAALNGAELQPHVALIINLKSEICVVNLSRNLALVKSLVLSSADGEETLTVVPDPGSSAFYNTVTETGGVIGPSEVLRYTLRPAAGLGTGLQVKVSYLYGPTGTTDHEAVFALHRAAGSGAWVVG